MFKLIFNLHAARLTYTIFVALAALMLISSSRANAQACWGTHGPCFQGLGFLDSSIANPSSEAHGISPDGNVVVGWSTDAYNYTEGFKWQGLMTGLGFLACPPCDSQAFAINNQALIVGRDLDRNSSTEAVEIGLGGTQPLGYLCQTQPFSSAYAIAAQANIPVGQSIQCNGQAVATIFGNPITALASLSAGASNANAYGVSADGKIIVGESSDANGKVQAARWSGGSVVGLGFLASTDTASRAYAVNSDGSVIVGFSGQYTSHIVRWTNGTVSDLGCPSNGEGRALNFDGSVVVGSCFFTSRKAIRWTAADGIKTVEQLLTAAGVSFAGWSLTDGYSVSADGLTIVGTGSDPNGRQQGWIARLPLPNPRTAHDLNGDGKADIIWRNNNGDVSVWFMNGGQILSGAGLGNISTDINIVGSGDFDGDGHTDILWRDSAGNVSIWFMNGGQIVSKTSLGNVPTAWSVAGVGDFDADGRADILWRNTSGDATIWFMNGSQITSGTKLGNIPVAWSVAGVGDVNGDGSADILWRNTTGDLAIWFISGAQIVSGAGLGNVPTSWTIAGLRDFDGDRKADILWRNSNGDVAMWLMNGAQIASGRSLGNIPTLWSIVQTLDFSGDGKSDILWRNTSGDISMWLMNGAQIISGTGLGNVPYAWTVQNTNAN